METLNHVSAGARFNIEIRNPETGRWERHSLTAAEYRARLDADKARGMAAARQKYPTLFMGEDA